MVSRRTDWAGRVFGNQGSVLGLPVLVLTVALLGGPATLLAQRGRGGEGINATSASRPIICVYDCRDLSRGDDLTGKDLKNFENLMAVQATAEQIAAFTNVLEESKHAGEQLKALRESPRTVQASEQKDRADTVDQSLKRARTGSQNFLASFSQVQKTGLKDVAAKLITADTGLGKEEKAFVDIMQAPAANTDSIGGSAVNLDQALTSFQRELLGLGRAMSILPTEGQDLTFHLPQATSSVEIEGQTISIPAGGAVMRTSMADGRNFFSVRLVAELSELQDSATDIFRSQLNRSPRCGERIDVQRAMLLPESAASLAVVHLHHERWFCPPGRGGSEQLVAADDAAVEIMLSPTVEPGGSLHLVSEIRHVEASGFLHDSIQSGALGEELRERISAVVLSVLATGADLKATLPPVAQQTVAMQKAQFQDAGAGQLSLVLDGQLQFSDEQTRQFALQLKEQLSAQSGSPQ